MKILLTAINAKYIHSSLSIRYLSSYSQNFSEHIKMLEYTINNAEDFILSDIFLNEPDVVCFSCYIWNINMVTSLSRSLKKVLPNLHIICGGPEVSYGCENFLEENPSIDIVIYGEGEKTFNDVVFALINSGNLDDINGIFYRNGGKIISSAPQPPLSLSELPFVYDNLSDLQNKIIYYETQRGCPYDCQFCLSSVEKGVRFVPIEKVYKQLDFFLQNKVRQVKFVDRTFNCGKTHANAIWKYLIENDNGITNFHMEIEAHIMDNETLSLLKTAREGLFQFEIGVQSTNEKTLIAVKRNPDFLSLKERILKIIGLENIHVHLDLIAGLPYEDYYSFKNSFNDVYALNPHQLQMGFLKLLKGSGLKRDADKYLIKARESAPYEVLSTGNLPYKDVLRLKGLENMLETYRNSGKAIKTTNYMCSIFSTPVDFYESLAEFWLEKNYHKVNHNKESLYTILYEFSLEKQPSHVDIIKELLKFDMLTCDNLSTMPVWIENTKNDENMRLVRKTFFNNSSNLQKYLPKLADYTPAQLSRMCRLEPFKYDILRQTHKETYILFNYYERDFLYNHGKYVAVEVRT